MNKAIRLGFFIFLTLLLVIAGTYFFFGKQFLGKKTKAQLIKIYAWEFNKDKELEGWNGIGFSEGVTVTAGNLKAGIFNKNKATVFPTLFSPFMKLDAKMFNRLEVRMKVLTESVAPTPTSTPSPTIITGVRTSSGKPFTLTVSFSNPQAKTDDWIGLAKAQEKNIVADDRTYLDWKWLNNSQGLITFENVQPGNYLVRYYTRKNTSPWPWEILATNPITVGEEPMLGKPVSNIAPMPPPVEGSNGSMLLMFGPSNSDYSGKQSAKIETAENGEFNTYVFDLSRNPDWQGLISQIKLVPTFNSPRTIFIDWIRFSSTATVTPTPVPVKTELPVTEFGTVVEQSLISSVTNLSAAGTKPIAPPPTKISPKKSYSLKTDDGRMYPLQYNPPVPPCKQGKRCMVVDPIPPEIYFGKFVGKMVLIEGTMKQNVLFKCPLGTNCQPPSITWWPLPNGLTFEVKNIQLAQKGQDTSVLGIPQGYIQNATAMYTGENVYVLVTQSVIVGVAEKGNKQIMPPVKQDLYIRSSYADLSPYIGKSIPLQGWIYTVGTNRFMNLGKKGISNSIDNPPKLPPLK